jgi:RND superfamily putative drug exporter
VVIAAIIAITAAAYGLPVVGILIPSGSDFSDPGSESGRAEAVVRGAGRGQYGDVLVLIESRKPILRDAKALLGVSKVRQMLKRDPAVVGVDSLHDSDGGMAFVSRDGRATYLAVSLAALTKPQVRDAIERLRTKLERWPNAKLGGTEVSYDDISKQSEKDLVKAELIAFPLLLLAALWIFRGLVAALLPLLVGAMSIVVTLAAVRAVNEVTELSSFGLNLVTALSLGLAIDYSLFILSRFREELASAGEPRQAADHTIATAGRTVAVSALTVAAALAALLVFPQRFLITMGICGALVALSALTVALTVLPAVLTLLGRRVDSVSLPRWRLAAARDARHEEGGFWYRLSMTVMKRPAPVATLAALALLLLALPITGLKFVPFDATMLPASAEARQVDDSLRGRFSARGAPAFVAVRGSKRAAPRVERLTKRINRMKDVVGATATPLDRRTWQIVVSGRHPTSSEGARRLIRDLRAIDTSLPNTVGGETATSMDKLSSLGSHLIPALAILATVTLLLLFILTGSVLLPIKTLVINALTVSATFGVLVLIFQHGLFHEFLGFTTQDGLEATQPVLLLALAIGLSTDYGVFLLARITEAHRNGAPAHLAAALGIQRTGRIVTAAAVMFCIAVGTLAVSPIVFIKLMGLGAAIAVVLDATIARALLVPSLIALFGRWNWWAPRPLRRFHEWSSAHLGESSASAPAAGRTSEPAPAVGAGQAIDTPPAEGGMPAALADEATSRATP